MMRRRCAWLAVSFLTFVIPPPARADDPAATGATAEQSGAPAPAIDVTLPPIEVVRSRIDLLGSAATASEGTVTQQELDLRPNFRVGQLLEAVPGLVVTVHSGEGKANQFLIRG